MCNKLCEDDNMEVSQLIEKFSELTEFLFINNSILVTSVCAQLHRYFVFYYL